MEKDLHMQENVGQLEELEKLTRRVEELTTKNDNNEQKYKDLVASLQESNSRLCQELKQQEELLRLKNARIQELELQVADNPVEVKKLEKHLTSPRSNTEKTPVQETPERVVIELGKKNKELETKIKELKEINAALNQKIEQQREKTKRFKDKCKQLVAKGRVCSIDCLLCIIHWIYQITLGFEPICNRLLEKLIMHEAKEIKNEEVSCGRLMSILHKCGIVSKGTYIYNASSCIDSKGEEAKKAWKTLMARPMDEEVCILGDMWDDDTGHCWAVELKSRNNNTMKIHDPQNGWVCEASEEVFEELVTEFEDEIQLLMVYTVNVEQMKQIYEKNKDIFKQSEPKHSTFINRDVSVVRKDL